MKSSILITRPKDQAQRIVQHLKNNGFEVFVEPTFEVQKINAKSLLHLDSKKIQALILTSTNAAEVAFEAAENFGFAKDLKIFAVGKKTAEIFVDAGFNNITISEKGSAEDLLRAILFDDDLKKSAGAMLYFCGEIVTIDFGLELGRQGFEVEKIISYKISESENFSDEFVSRVKKSPFDFVLLYSKNSARHFCDLVKKHNLLEYFEGSQLLCFSEKICSFVRCVGFENSATFDAIPILKNFYD